VHAYFTSGTDRDLKAKQETKVKKAKIEKQPNRYPCPHTAWLFIEEKYIESTERQESL
jgi:hypothetical protein